MAPNTSVQDNDPVVATYNVYLNAKPERQRAVLLQYPDRSLRRPYGPSLNQTPVSFRSKPSTGLVEVDVPIDTTNYYNRARGSSYADALHKSHINSTGGSQGLAGGFNTGPAGRTYTQDDNEDVDMETIPRHGAERALQYERELKVQTLGGMFAKVGAGDPIYMLGSFSGSELHLTRLDSVIQLRPLLHHLDAADELAKGALKALKKGQPPEKSSATETRAVEIKIKSAEERHADRTRKKTNAEMLNEIQAEPWQTYHWLDEVETTKTDHHPNRFLRLQNSTQHTSDVQLTSALSPTSYLDAISAPRIDLSQPSANSNRSLGLMGKVRGRERERRRRKKNDADRKAAAEAAAKRIAQATQQGEAARDDTDEAFLPAVGNTVTGGREDDEDDETSQSSGNEDGFSSEDENQITQSATVVDDGSPTETSNIRTSPRHTKTFDKSEDDVVESVQPGSSIPAVPLKRPRGRPPKKKAVAEDMPDRMVVDDGQG